MGFVNVESILPSGVVDNISKEMIKLDIKDLEPKLADPSLIQIDGYVHSIENGNTHLIEKEKPFLTEEDKNFQPITFSDVDLKNKEVELQELILDNVHKYLKSWVRNSFNRVINLEILGVDEEGIGWASKWKIFSDYLYVSYTGEDDIKLYVVWKVSYKCTRNINGDSKKLPTIGKPNYVQEKETLVEKKETNSQKGEIMICFPKGSFDSITPEIAMKYLAIKALDGIRLTVYPDENTKTTCIDGNGVVNWSKHPNFKYDVQTNLDFQSDEAKEKLEEQKEATKKKLESSKEEINQSYQKMITDAKGEFAARKEELKYQFNELKTLGTELDEITATFAKKMAELPALSIVTTPTGPGVAVNAIMTQLGNLKSTATSMNGIISKIENLMSKMRLDVYAPLIPSLNEVYMVTKNLISLAKTAIKLVGG